MNPWDYLFVQNHTSSPLAQERDESPWAAKDPWATHLSSPCLPTCSFLSPIKGMSKLEGVEKEGQQEPASPAADGRSENTAAESTGETGNYNFHHIHSTVVRKRRK